MSSNRLNLLPPYLFADLDRKKRELQAKGADIIDLSIGDPDLPTPPHIIDALCIAARDPKNHRYPPYNGTKEFREAAARYLLKSRGIKLDPDTEILTLIGSKEGIAHAPFALTNPGDVILVPSPGYPVYASSTILSGGTPFELPLRSENYFLPDLSAIPKDVLKKVKILFLNYPNNPTSATATKEFFKDVVAFAHKHNILICHDAAYIEMVFDGYKAPSILEIEGAKEVAIEFYSLSKTYNMTGWRIGFAAGNKDALAALGKIKTNIDSSATAFVQHAGAVALTSDQKCVAETCAIYKKRRDILVNGLQKAGWKITPTKATFYVWAIPPAMSLRVPEGDVAIPRDVTSHLLQVAHIAVTPGIGFGAYGKDYIRFSLTSSTERIEEAVKRIKGSIRE